MRYIRLFRDSPTFPITSTTSRIQYSITLSLIFFFTSALQFDYVAAHQAICYPRPISRVVACRISHNSHCPGPCPDSQLRKDQNPNNPSLTAMRGQNVEIFTLRNNHDGGFVRWSIVNLRDKMRKAVHKRNTFLYTCADLRPTKCIKKFAPRDCQYDRANEYFRHIVRIPTVIPDGVYILGWAWYGGGRTWGMFGDYYDCMYVRIQGGPLTWFYKPQFFAGPSRTGGDGFCKATVDRLGICYSEPCPGGGRFTKRFKPFEFSNGRIPSPLKQPYFKPYLPKPKTKKSPRILSMTIRSSDYPDRIYAVVRKHGQAPHLKVTTRNKITITCEVDDPDNVKFVSFFAHGEHARTDIHAPYSLTGDWFNYRWRFAGWAYDYNNKVISITCKAQGFDATVDFLSMELSTSF